MNKRIRNILLALLVIFGFTSFINPVNLFLFKVKKSPKFEDGQNIAEKLGYHKKTKLLVVNSDDTGGHPNFTDGVIEVMEFGLVKSTSILVNDRNDEELKRIAELTKQHPNWGFGIHLSLNNEYQHRYPWKPVLPIDQVPSLYNSDSLAWEKVEEVQRYVNPKHAALEFKAQIQKALDFGIELTHIDSHMGTCYLDSEYQNASVNGLREAAMQAAIEFNLPMTVNTFDKNSAESIYELDEANIIRPDAFFGFYELSGINEHMGYEGSAIKKYFVRSALKWFMGLKLPYEDHPTVEEDYPDRMEVCQQAIKKLVRPGLNHFFMHAALGDSIPDGKHHAAGVDDIVRQSDLAVWTSDEMKQFLEDEKIVLINYSDLKRIMDGR